MSEKQFFTDEELPFGMIMFIAKTKSGKELAAVVHFDEAIDRVISTYRFLLYTVRDIP
jgi:hypothetical protein